MLTKEVVDTSKIKGHSDANLVEENIKAGIIRMAKEYSKHTKGDQALIEIFRNGKYDIIATDDIKLTRLLKATAIPFIFPGLLVYSLYRRKIMERRDVLSCLNRISTFISDDEYSAVRLLLEKNNEY